MFFVQFVKIVFVVFKWECRILTQFHIHQAVLKKMGNFLILTDDGLKTAMC